MSYLPLQVFDDFTPITFLPAQNAIGESQRPHVFFNPTLSTGGEMTLPMYWHRNYLSISSAEWNQMGMLIIRSLNNLKHANGATDGVTMSVFGWAENVTTTILTSTEPVELVAQMGEIDEANAKGTISGPATAIANVASSLSRIPMISSFATATEIMARAVGASAKLFGFARPPLTVTPMPFQPRPMGSMACSTLPDTLQKLTLDDKQELSIDPKISGLTDVDDPFCITDIASRSSYLTTFSWPVASNPTTLLWNTGVTPYTWGESDGALFFPPCCYAALPFKYWTGTLNYRFQIVCSSFHRGRLKIVYDPNYIASQEWNVNYIHVVDIAETQDFCISVSNGQKKTLLDRLTPGVSLTPYTTTPIGSKPVGNGVLGIYVLNELAVPNTTVDNDIQVNVFVSAGDDFELFVPSRDFQEYVTRQQPVVALDAQMGMEMEPATTSDNPDCAEMSIQLGPKKKISQYLNRVFIGESVRSFRQLLKRYNHSVSLGGFPTLFYKYIFVQLPLFPMLKGTVAGAVHVANNGGVDFAYNFANTNMLHWCTLPYSGYRGSVRWKMFARGRAYDGDSTNYTVTRTDEPLSYAFVQNNLTGYQSGPNTAASSGVTNFAGLLVYSGFQTPFSGVEGMAMTLGSVNDCLEWEVPFFSDERFIPGKKENWTIDPGYTFSVVRASARCGTQTVYDLYCAAGEDFTAQFWTGMPPMYLEATPPNPIG